MRKSDEPGLPVVLAAAVPLLAFRLGLGFLRFQGKRRRGARVFESALLAGGMPPTWAAQLTHRYHEAGSLRRILRQARFSRPWPRDRSEAQTSPSRP